MKGPGVKKNVQLSGCNIVDEAPTIAKLLGFEMKQADGQPIYGLLEE